MTLQFLKKEFLEIIFGPKFLITFAISAVLILSSVYSGYELYKVDMDAYARGKVENLKALENTGSYGSLTNYGSKTLREPEKLSIFVKGVENSIGRAALVSTDPRLVLRDSRFGLNPVFAVFGELDLAFIVKLIMALFALLFSYNAISGERELGTLKQVMSYSVGRASFLIGKVLGGLLSLLLTFIIPFLFSLLILNFLFNMTFSGSEWLRLILMALFFCLYLSVFYMFGILTSALSRNSFISFLLGLFIWVLSIVILPKASVEIAGQLSPAPSIDVMEAERASLNRQYYQELKKFTEENFKNMYNGDPATFGEAFQKSWGKANEDAEANRNKQAEPLLREYERKQLNLLRMAENLSRISPSSCLTLAVNRLALTDASLKNRFIEALQTYREELFTWVDEKKKQYPDRAEGGVNVSVDGDHRVQITVPEHKIDVNGLPDFNLPKTNVDQIVSETLIDFSILIGFVLIIFAGAFIAFVRYDVR